jgi:hypothetical protein
MLFDFETRKWSILCKNADYPEWSRQSKPYVYFIRDDGVYRVRITDHGVPEKIADIGFELAGGYSFRWPWFGLAPDDSVLALRRESSQEIYALDFEAP